MFYEKSTMNVTDNYGIKRIGQRTCIFDGIFDLRQVESDNDWNVNVVIDSDDCNLHINVVVKDQKKHYNKLYLGYTLVLVLVGSLNLYGVYALTKQLQEDQSIG